MPQGEDGNIALIGGNGSGKTSSIIKRTLRTWKGGICATDLKGELADHYQRLAQRGEVERPYIVFDPRDEQTPSYDPFGGTSEDDEADLVENIGHIASVIFPDLPDTKDPFWIDTERRIFEAALLYYCKLGLSFSESVCKIMGTTTSELCKKLAECQDIYVKMILGEGGRLKPETIACVDQGLRNKLQVFAVDPHISHAFRGRREGAVCFTWDDLDTYNIFLRVPEDKVDAWGPAINLMYAQLFRYLVRRPEKYGPSGEKTAPVLLMLDEAPRLGRIEKLAEYISTLRSKNVNICLVMQSLAQLDKIYGRYDRQIIFDNCQYKAILRAGDAETQKHLAELIGTELHLRHSVSETFDGDMSDTGYSQQLSETRDWKVFPHKLSMLKDVLLLTPHGFYRVDKAPPIYSDWQVSPPSVNDAAPNTLVNPSLKNPGAKMLTIEARFASANRRAAEAGYYQVLEQEE